MDKSICKRCGREIIKGRICDNCKRRVGRMAGNIFSVVLVVAVGGGKVLKVLSGKTHNSLKL